MSPEHVDPLDEGARQRLEDLEKQAVDDRAAIEDLSHQSTIDRALILELREQGLLDRDQIVNLQLALHASRRIGAAIGILMSSRKLTETAAFETLKTHSQSHRLKLRDVAEVILLTGTI
jgi:AmiR/NasT family two-component response regulator